MVLILFIIVSSNLLSLTTIVEHQAKSYQRIHEIDKVRLTELAVISHLRNEQKNGLLLSDEISIDTTTIYYTIDDYGTTFGIFVRISHNDEYYEFTCKLNKESCRITEFQYL